MFVRERIIRSEMSDVSAEGGYSETPYPSLTVSASYKESSGGGKSSSRRRPVRPSFDASAAADNEFITLLHGSDPVKLELNRLENEVRGSALICRFRSKDFVLLTLFFEWLVSQIRIES